LLSDQRPSRFGIDHAMHGSAGRPALQRVGQSLCFIMRKADLMTNGPLQPNNYVDPALPRPVPAWGQRAHRTYLNAVEVFAPFAALVIVAQLAGKADATTTFLSASFFYLRLAHAIIYWAALPYLRTILFTLAFVAEVGIFWEVVK
jgi:uncharacterized MAPEG superfamily protein